MRKNILMSLIVVLGVSALIWPLSFTAYAYNYTIPGSSNGTVALDDANVSQVLVPRMNLLTAEGNWSSPHDYYPVYSAGQNVSGAIAGFLNAEDIGVAALRLNVSSLNEVFSVLAKLLANSQMGVSVEKGWLGYPLSSFYEIEKGRFNISDQRPGLYALVVANLSNLSVMTAVPMLVTNEQVVMESDDSAKIGDPLKVSLSLLGDKNMSRIHYAALISEDDYRAIRIDLGYNNGSSSGTTSRITSGVQSMQLLGQPKISQAQVQEVVPLLPQDSAVAMQLSNTSESVMYLLTETTWKPGRYILTGAVYSGKGLDGIVQKTIEMVI
jgi:methanogen extracellular protein (TIGR04279 family)